MLRALLPGIILRSTFARSRVEGSDWIKLSKRFNWLK
jgi:hypothetical protein